VSRDSCRCSCIITVPNTGSSCPGRADHTRDEVFLLEENQSTFIPLGVKHRIENPGKIPLHIIEVQSAAIWAKTICALQRPLRPRGSSG